MTNERPKYSGWEWLNISARLGPKPDGRVEQELWSFAVLAGQRASHPRDMQRFYQFVARSHARRSGMSRCDVRTQLLNYGFEEDIATYLADAYWHGRCALAVSRKFKGSYARWQRKDAERWA